MARINWKRVMDHRGDVLLTRLHDLEVELLAGLRGIGHFLVKRVPELLRELEAWMRVQFAYGIRVAIRIGRLLGVILALLAIVFGPLVAFPGFLTGIWAVVAMAGAWWGLDRHSKNLSLKWSVRKEATRARS